MAHESGGEFRPRGEAAGVNGGAPGGQGGRETAGMVEGDAISYGGARIGGVA